MLYITTLARINFVLSVCGVCSMVCMSSIMYVHLLLTW